MTVRRRLAIVLGLVAAFALASCSTNAGTAASAGPTKFYPVGKRTAAPAVAGVPLLGGGTFDLASERGHVVVINFWGSWCGPCRAEAADLESSYTSSGVVFIGVNEIDQQDAANAFVSAHRITYPSIFDPSGRVVRAFDAVPPSAIPTTLVIDATGKIAAIQPSPVSASELAAMIKAAQQS